MIDIKRLKQVYATLQQGGYNQDFDTFRKGFAGNENYANRKRVYDLLSANGAQIGKTYEEFMQNMQKPKSVGNPTVNKYRQQMFNSVDPNKSRASELTHRAVSQAKRAMNNVRKPVRGAVVNKQGKKVSEFDITPAKTLDDLNREYAQEVTSDWEKEQQRQSLYNTTRSLDEVQRKIAERDAQLDEADNGFWTGIRHAAQGMNVTGGMFQQYDDDIRKELIDPKYKQYLVEANYLTQMKKQLIQEEEDAAAPNATKWDRFKHASSSFTSGMLDEAFGSDAFDFGGYNKIRESDVLLRISDRINRGVATDDDRRLLQILKDNEEIESRLDNDAYSFGRGASQSAGFVTDFLITGGGDFGGLGRLGGKMALGLARKTFAKTMTKDLGKRFAAWSLKNLGKTLGEATGAAMTATSVQVGKTAANATQRYLGLDSDDGGLEYDKDGNLKFKGGTDVGTAIAKAIASGTIENYTELLGPHITSMGKRLFGWAGVGLEKITPDALSKFFDKVGSSELFKRIGTFTDEIANSKVLNAGKKALAKVGVNDMPEEGLEEEAGIILNSLITGDNKFSDLWDKETQYKTWGGVMSMMGAMRAIPIAHSAVGTAYSASKNKVEYFKCKHDLTKAETLARQSLGDKWTPIKELIDNADNKHIIEVGVNIIRQSDKYSQEQAKAAQNYIGQLLKMRGFNNATMASIRDKNAKGEGQTDADKEDIEVSNAYAEGHEAEGELRHLIQLEYEKRTANLAKRLGLTPEKIDAMHVDSFSSYIGLNSDADFDIFQYKKAKAAYDGVMDNAQNLVDIAGEVAAQRVDNMTNVHDGTIRKAYKKGTEMNPDSPVYIISGNIKLNDDGSINYTDSDKMLVVYDEETGQREAIGNFMLASVDPNMQNAEEVKAQAIQAAKQKIITEQSNVIDGILAEGSEFTMESNDGSSHNYKIVQVDEQGNCIVSVDGTVLPEPLSLDVIQRQYDQSNVARSVKNDQTVQESEQIQQESQPIEDKFDYAKITNVNDGKVKSVDVTDEEGKNRFPNAKAVFLIQDKGAMPKFVVMDEEGNLTSYVGKRGDKIHLKGEMTIDEYKKQRQEELQMIAEENADSSMIEDNSGTIEADRGGIEVEDNTQPLSEADADNVIAQMESSAETAPELELTPDNWVVEFGEDGIVSTPIGEVKMGENQVAKLFEKGRSKEFGMIKPTLTNPDVIIEVPSHSADGNEERSSSYLFIKTFLGKNGKKVYYFKSVTIKKDGLEISISSHYDRAKRVKEALMKGKLLYRKNDGAQTEQNQPSTSVTTSQEDAAGSSESKDTNISSNGNENNESLTFEDGTPIPVDVNGEVDLSQTDASHAAEWYDNNLGEDADDWLDGEIKKAKKVLEQAKNKKLAGTKPSELVASKKEKEAAIADAQAHYDSAISIRDSLKERRIAKKENTAEGRKELFEKARRKFARLKSSVNNDAEAVSQLYRDTVGSLLHRLYDSTGVDVFDDTTNTVDEYVAANVAPYSLNYEGNENSKGVQQETGLSRSDFAKLGWLAKDGKGTTIDAMVHHLWDNRPSNLENADTQEIRNALLSLITSGQTAFESRNYIQNQRIDQAEKALEEQQRQEENAAYAEQQRTENTNEKINENINEQEDAPEVAEQTKFPDKLKEGSKAIEVPEDATDEKPLGEQRTDSPFSARKNGKQQTEAERAADVEKNKVDDVGLVDAVIGEKIRKSFERIAKMMGAKIRYQRTDKLGNGWIQETTDADGNVHRTIFITLDSSITEGAQFIFGHEMTHQIKNLNPAAYNELTQLVLDTYGSDAFDKAVDKTMQRYSDAGFSGRARDYYAEEVVADAVGEMIRDLNLAHTLAMKMSHPLLAAIHEILKKIKLAFFGTEYSDVTKNIIRSIEQAYVKTANGQVTNSETGEDVSYSLRQKPEPKKKGIGYKVFVLKDGKLYPPMVANPDGAATPVGVWLDADAAPIAGESKTGRPQVKQGGKGTQGGSGKLAYRPDWHLGVVPYAIQFNRKDAEGNKTLFPKNFVFAEVEYAADVDYQEEARQEGINPSGKYQHSLAGLKHLPTDGYYMYRTNPNPETDPWVITGAMKVNRILTRAEQADLVSKAGREPQQIQEGDIVTDDVVNSINQEIADAPKFSLKVYHGSGADFTEFDFDHMGEGAGSQVFGWGGYVTSSKKIGKSYANLVDANAPHQDVEYVGNNAHEYTDVVAGLFNGGQRDYDDVKEFLQNGYNSDMDNARKKQMLEWFESTKPSDWKSVNDGKRNLYEVDIPDDNGSNYLDYENPMNEEQINTIRDGLAKKGVDVSSWEKRGFKLDLPFKDVYAAVLPMMMRCEPKEVSKFLSSLGYTGIKYPAGTIMGGAEEGDTNYVIFKPEDMKITEHTKFSIKTYHGSQASFDHFDHSFMGSGEGAQAYGWGTYVSEVEGIAKAYAKQNAAKHGMPRDYKIAQLHLNHAKFEYEKVQRAYNNSKAYIDSLKEDLQNYRESMARRKEKVAYFAQNNMPETVDKLLKQIKRAEDTIKVTENDINMRTNDLEGWKPKLEEVKKKYEEEQKKFDAIPKPQIERNLYSVDIPDDTGENYIGWDEKMTPRMRDIRKEILEDNGYKLVDSDDMRDYFEDRDGKEYELFKEQYKTGGTFYEELAQLLHSQKLASLALKEYGFDGVKVIAERNTGGNKEGKMNYVIFDENNAQITNHTKFSLRLKSAIEETETNPSDAQKESGNYKKGHIKFGGYDYTIENPKGSTRSGNDANGKEWKVTMHDTYGYIRGKFGKDGDHLDMFINDKADLDNWDGDVFVVDQVNPDGSFDEHKVMYGYDSMDDAEKAYLANYSKGWKGLGNITGASKAEFDKWLDTSNRKLKPFADYAKVKFSQAQSVSEPRFSLKDIKPVGVGAFGNIYNQFRGKSKAAIEFLKKLGSGEATAALHHHTIGDISLVWGDKKTGLDKILRKHPEVVDNLQSIIDSMEVVQESDNRIKLESPTHFAVVSKEYKGEPREQWLLTAYEKRESLENGKSMDTATSSLGGDTALSQSKESAAKIDNSSETSKENGEKFSLKDEKNMFGMHNISLDKLRKAIKQGGFAAPSMGVIDSKNGIYSGYGEITLIPKAEKIAKRTGKNIGTYAADAWTPIYPPVEKKFGGNGGDVAYDDIESVPKEMQRLTRNAINSFMDGREANGLAYLYLQEKGKAPELVHVEGKYPKELHDEVKGILGKLNGIYNTTDEQKEKLLDLFIREVYDGNKEEFDNDIKKFIKKDEELIKKRPNSNIAKNKQLDVDWMKEHGYDYGALSRFVDGILRDAETSGKVDENATMKAAQQYIQDKGMKEDFDSWKEKLNDRYNVEEVIFAGYKPDGNRKYLPNTVENAVKVMKQDGKNASVGSASFSHFVASILKPMGTLDQIRKKKGNLTGNYEDVEKFQEKWQPVYDELADKMQPDAEPFESYGMDRLEEVATQKNPKKYAKEEYGVDLTDEDINKLNELIEAVKNDKPSIYFETKFMRPYGLDEFEKAIVPNDTPSDVVDALKMAGIDVSSYERGNAEDRQKVTMDAINSSDNIRFSLKSMMAKPEGWKQANKKAIHIAEAIERDPKFSLKNLDGTLIKAGTYFSGGGLVEEGLKGIIDPVVAVEYDEKISGVYRNNFGQHIVTADVRDVDPKELVKQIDGEVEYFHASPVCKNYSQAKSNHAEVELDKETAASTAEFINAIKPKVVTIENVKGYKDSDAMKTITDALDANGYTWDADVYNAADYGGYTNRERLIVRAVRDGKLPAKPKKMAHKSGWYEAVADIIPTLTEKKNGVAPWMDIRLKADGIDWRNIDKPLYVMGSAYADGKIPHAFADELLPTLRTKSGDVIVMPDGKVYRAMGRVLARVSGVSDDYKMPFSENLSHTIIGNGIPTQLTEHVIAPLLQNTLRPTTPDDGNTKFSLRGSTPYDKQMEEWMEKNHLEKGAVPMEKPVMKEGENIFDYANRMVEWTRNQNLWKTAPKQTGFQDALDKWKADNGLSPDAYPPVRPHRENYSTEIGYAEDLEEYNNKKELWKSAPKPKDFDLSVDLEDMNKQLRNIRRAVLNQKNYDQRTVKAVSDLVRKMLNIGWGDGLSRGKVGYLLSAAKNATGANDVKKYLDKAMGILAENYLNRLSTAYDNLINTKGARADQSGVIKMGSLDANGQAFMSEYKKAINMDDKSLNNYIANIEEDSAKNEDNVEMNDYRLAGIQAAIMYKQQIGGNDADIAELKRQIGELKNKKDATKEDKDLLKSLEKKLFENKFDRITMFENLLNNIQRMVKESKGRAKEFREKIAEHKNEIQHRANLDLEGVDSTYYDTTTAKKKFVNNDLQRAVFSSTYTFEQFLKFFGKHSANGEGRLYNYFHKLNQDALDEEQLYNEMNRNALDEKTKELFGKNKFMNLVGIDGKGMKEMDVEVTDYSNKKTGKRTIHLKQGQMLYIYLVNKETDGEMKLRAMGITEEDVAAIEENLDPRVKAMGEWLQDEYLPECQRRYQATHTKYFGAPMKEVENYFPLAINNRARNVKEDVNQDSDAMSQLAGTSTGAIVTRRVNVIPLDIENADAFEVAFNHLQEMEEWSAMLPFRQDINTLLSYTHFRNQVQNMSSVAYGSGKTLWDEFKQTAQIAAGTYKPKVNAGMMDSRIAAAMGGIAVAKISGRLWTAIKQSQSATVFLPECDFTRFVKNGVNPYGSWKWAMENIPDFRKRVENMTYGDVKLRQYLDELEKWHDWTKTISKIGMVPNILVDGITCAVGARSVYETEVNRLTKLGYPKEKAEEKAYYKAVAAYNKTQQSSGGMYLSPMQVDRTYVSAALSLFKNANFAYGRMQIEACRGLARTYDFWGGKHKTTLIESMTRQIMEEDGLDENTARAIAKATYNRTFRQSIGRLINFATLVPVSWALYKVLPYLLTGDDDDKKKDMIEEAVLKGFATSLSDNYVIPFVSNILNAGLKVEDGKPTFDPEVFRYQNLYINPATSDLANIYSMVGNQKWYSVANKLGMLGVQSLIGFNPETVGALYQALSEADYDNGNTAKEWQIGILKAISAPEESIRELYMDELGLKSGNIKKIPLAELEKRYAERQINRDNLLSQIGMDAETFNGYVDKYQKSFEKKIKDKMDKWDEYDKKKADEFFDTTSDPKLRDMIEKKRTKDANAAANEQIAKEGLNQEKKGKEPSEEAYNAVKMSIDVAEDNAISTYNKVLNKRYAALNDEYNEQTDAMKYIFMSKHPNFKAYKELESEYTNYGKKIKELKEKLVSADGYDAKQTILKQIRAEREKFSELQSKVR